MSSESLPLKHRPRRFVQVVGQDTLSSYLAQLIKLGQIGKNLCIYGAWGSGKTTSARIYAQALHCDAPTADGDPCFQCASCAYYPDDPSLPITHPDYREFDGATRGGKEEIRAELEIARQPPLLSKYRIFVIDECQGVSKQGFDALLKIVEEPPPYLVFIFLTTENEKVRPAIKSRCQNFEVKLLDVVTARALVEKVCVAEQFKYEPAALDLITFISHGHPRDLLKNLEQVAQFGDITLETAKLVFSLGYIAILVKYTQALLSGDQSKQIQLIRDWPEPAARKVECLQEFFVFLYYAEVLKLQITVNPVLALIPEGDRRSMVAKFREKAENGGRTVAELWNTISTFWTETGTINTDSVLDLYLVRFHNLLNIHNLSHTFTPPKNKLSTAHPSGTPIRTSREVTTTEKSLNPANPLLGGFDPSAYTPAAVTPPSTFTPPTVGAPAQPPAPVYAAPVPAPVTPPSIKTPQPPGEQGSPSWSMASLGAQQAVVPDIIATEPVASPPSTRKQSRPSMTTEPPPTPGTVYPHHLNHLRGFEKPIERKDFTIE